MVTALENPVQISIAYIDLCCAKASYNIAYQIKFDRSYLTISLNLVMCLDVQRSLDVREADTHTQWVQPFHDVVTTLDCDVGFFFW